LPDPVIGSGAAADIGASRRLSQSKPALSGTYPCPSRLGQTWIGSRPLKYAGGFRCAGLLGGQYRCGAGGWRGIVEAGAKGLGWALLRRARAGLGLGIAVAGARTQGACPTH
jgi:hypothetical protein